MGAATEVVYKTETVSNIKGFKEEKNKSCGFRVFFFNADQTQTQFDRSGFFLYLMFQFLTKSLFSDGSLW